MSADILNRIVEVKWDEIAAAKLKRSLTSQREEAEGRKGQQRGFERALRTKV
ncbi:indole-3-glycerol-phosphate synthase TrpC, partial [Pelomonas sp. HMWF004]